jgi:diguanylate cyclase (GGDEF)-like protein
MARQHPHQTATGQAALLFALAGTLGLMTELTLTSTEARTVSVAVNVVALAFAAALYLAPWERLPASASLVAAPVAFALLAMGQRFAPGAPTVYGIWFVVVFAWIGFWHPPRTAIAFAPLGALGYVLPFIGVASTPRDAIASVTIAIPACAILGEVLARKMAEIHQTQRELVEARNLLERANLTDDLTGLGNRRRSNSLLDSMQPGDGLVLLDLDHFKRVNDMFGHAEGDRVLAVLGEFLRSAVRDADTVARFGGEEFLIVLRGAGAEAGDATARLLGRWREQAVGVTLSAGVAVHVADRGPSETFGAADAALYAAKDQGRDRVVHEAAATSAPHAPVV